MNRNVTATILIVLAIGIYLTYTSDKVKEVKAVQEANKEYITALKNAEELIKIRKDVMDKSNAISDADRKRLDKIIPNTVDNIRLIIDLNDIAQSTSITLRNIKANTSANAQKQANSVPAQQSPTTVPGGQSMSIENPVLDNVTVSFNVTTSYLQFIEFMRKLESSLRILDMTRLTVSVNQNGSYDFGVELKTYWLRQQ